MNRRSSARATALVLSVMLLVLVACGTVGVYAYDESTRDVIADGVTIGATEVGGMTGEEASELVRNELLEPFEEPLVVEGHGDEEFRLTAKEARIRADVSGMVADALAAGRDQGLLGRTWRGLSGGELDRRIEPRVAFSTEAVRRLVDRVRVDADRDPREAEASVTTTSVSVKEGRDGIATDVDQLKDDVMAAITDPDADRVVEAQFDRVEPELTKEEVREKYDTVLTVDRPNFRLRLFKDQEVVESYPIALGEAGQDTPTGTYEIANKAVDPAWNVPNSDWAGSLAGTVVPGGTPQNPLKARWLGIYNGVGIHGTDARGSIGTNASKGCIRMLIEDVKALYERVPVGTTVYID
ncbi:MAG: L,D-transpeptidase/peptidoglycan binding protein [Solirubrobacterales bacterium]|nr:L,D-transpeptidase/peptidoglycan binding protein [Solirubrobacterales bacterium]